MIHIFLAMAIIAYALAGQAAALLVALTWSVLTLVTFTYFLLSLLSNRGSVNDE